MVETQLNFDAIQLVETITRDTFLYVQQATWAKAHVVCVGDIHLVT